MIVHILSVFNILSSVMEAETERIRLEIGGAQSFSQTRGFKPENPDEEEHKYRVCLFVYLLSAGTHVIAALCVCVCVCVCYSTAMAFSSCITDRAS